MSKGLRVLLIVLFISLVLVFIWSLTEFLKPIYGYYESDKSTQELRKIAVEITPEEETVSSPAEDGTQPVQAGERTPISVDFPALMEINTDVRAWLYSPDTKINYPVVQAENNDYYLHRLVDKSYNPGGTLFIDYRCEGDFSGRNTVIYGHHMGDGSMLASIVDYKDQEYYDAHPVMYLNTPDGDYRLDVVCGFTTYFDSRAYIYEFESRTEFEEWFSLMRSYSDFECDVTVGSDDRLVTLSTCTYEYDNARYVVMAKLVPIG